MPQSGLTIARLHPARLTRWMHGRSAFFRNVSVMLAGSVIGQMTSVVLSPVLTRLFSPAEFGVLGVFTAVLTIIVVMASLRYEMAIPVVADADDAVALMVLCFGVLLATTGVVGAAAYAAPAGWLEGMGLSPLLSYRWLLPAGFGGLGAYFIVLYLATNLGAFPAIARTRISQGVLGPVSQIGLGLLGAGAPGLVLGYVLGQSAGAIDLLRRTVRIASLRAVRVGRIRTLAARFRRFPLIASWAALIDAAGTNQILYLLVSLQFSVEVAGFIFLSERIVARPLMMLGTSLLQVFVGEAGRTATTDPARLRWRFRQVVRQQVLVAVVWIAAANAGAALLFPAVFGADWAGAVVYVQALSVAYLAQAVVQPVFHTLQLLERQSTAAVWQAGRLVLVLATFGVCVQLGLPAPATILAYAVAQAAACLVLFLLIARAIQRIQP
ncbi:MAG: oligosaccharide flippase family protein [Gemmatimonadaceae bacterium]|nr:oligosaccharide flippase family protein [Acetobacteraceae bacterium]